MATSTAARRAPRAPQDHKPKASETGPEVPFSFRHKSKTYQLDAAAEYLTVGFVRTHRHLSQGEQLLVIIEALADEAALAAIDSMNMAEYAEWQKEFYTHNGIELGESEASSDS